MATVLTKPATLDDLLRAEADAPEGMRLALIDGEIVEWGANLTTRPLILGVVMTRLCWFLGNWFNNLGQNGEVAAGEARCRLSVDPEVIVGIDVGVWLDKKFEVLAPSGEYFDSPPVLVVDLVHPDELPEVVGLRLRHDLRAGVCCAWQIDASKRAVYVYQQGEPALTLIEDQQVFGAPWLPGLVIPLTDLFMGRHPSSEVAQ